MGRPQTASDEEILAAARAVIGRRGPDAFSIAEVAGEVGLSRAAIILRFGSTQALKALSLTSAVDQFAAALDTLPRNRGGDGLLHLGAFIGQAIGTRDSSARYFATYSANMHDHELRGLETRRGELLRAVISEMMPEVGIEHEAAVTAFRAHLAGSVVAWLGQDDPDARRFLVLRTRDWLRLAGIAFDEALAKDLSSPATPTPVKRVAATTRKPRPRAKTPKRSPRNAANVRT